MADDLTPIMRARLEKWRKNIIPVKNTEKVRNRIPNYRPIRGDYGDDIRDFENKDQKAWAKELKNNPIYRGYQ